MTAVENPVTVPLVDLAVQHAQVAEEISAGFAAVLDSGAFILGAAVSDFERTFAAFCGVRHCIGVGNGTDALELALRAAGVGHGHEVILPANTYVATAEAVERAGATPVLVDVDVDYQLIDVPAAAARVGAATRALLPVHLFGQIALMEDLGDLAASCGAVLIEDAAQAQGATRHEVPAGSLGLVAGTSFYPGKNLGAYGDAGAVLTCDDEVAATVRALRNHGSETKYEHPRLGCNSRLDSLQAVVLSAKLRRLASWNEQRRQAARRYDALLADLPEVVRPATMPGNSHVWHLYAVRVPRRDEVLRRLQLDGIGAGIHYPVPLHLLGALAHLGHRRGDFPVAEAAAGEILSLPLYPGITEGQQERVADRLRAALAS